jgi:dihydroorotase
VFGLPDSTIELGAKANLSLFNPDQEWTFDSAHILSKSKNAALLGTQMKGVAYGIVNQGQLAI